MYRAWSLIALCVGLVLGSAPAALSSEGAQHAEAQALVETGLKHARAGRFEVAVEHFDKAIKLYPHPEIAHNLARAHQELGNKIAAIGAFKRALEMDASYTYADDARQRITRLDSELRKTHGVLTMSSAPEAVGLRLLTGEELFEDHLMTPVTRYVPAGPLTVQASKAGFLDATMTVELAAGETKAVELVLRPVPKKGFLTVTADVIGAEVFVDGAKVGVTPLEGHAVSAGQHVVRLVAEGRDAYEASVTVMPNMEQRVSATLPYPGGAEAAGEGSSYGVLGGVLLGTGGAAAIVATALWVLAVDKGVEAQQWAAGGINDHTTNSEISYDHQVSTWSRLDRTAYEYNAGAVVTTIASGALIGTGLLLLLLPSGGEESEADAVTWSPFVTPGPDGVGVGALVRF